MNIETTFELKKYKRVEAQELKSPEKHETTLHLSYEKRAQRSQGNHGGNLKHPSTHRVTKV